jgi:transcription factor SPN1
MLLYFFVSVIKDDHEGNRNMDDDNFIDDTGVEPAMYGYDEPRSPGDAPQVGDLFP